MKILLKVLALTIILTACFPEEESGLPPEPPIRGLITTLVSASEDTTIRRYPGVLEPGEVNVLSFEVGGKLGRIDLSVGQRVTKGQVLARLDSEQFTTAIASRRAAIDAVTATLAQAEDDLARSETLLASGSVTRVSRDEDATKVRELKAELTQAQQSLTEAEENLGDTVLSAPFDGIVSTVSVDSFATVGAGQTVLTVYEASDFEVSFYVSFDVASRLLVGTPAKVRLSDDPSTVLTGVVSALGERADTVSSFPVVVSLDEVTPIIKAGMAVEAAFEFAVEGDRGFLIPISAGVTDAVADELGQPAGPNEIQPVPVFVFDPETSTVAQRIVTFSGIRGNNFVVVDGLQEGERVATKGVAYLREGMKVKLVERGN